MANLPEKNITLVDKITSIPSNSNLFLNADGEFRQASVNDVIKSATVVSDTVNNAINDAMQDSIDSHFKQATGSPILLTDTADGTLIDFKAYGRSTQKQYSGKNFLKCSLTTAITQNGITFTPVYDGKNLLYINVNGTATDNAYTTIASNVTIPSGTYILNGCPSGGGESTYRMYTNSLNYFDYGNGATFTLNAEYTFANLVIYVFKGQALNNLKFYPMIRLAGTDSTYEPYVGGTASPNPNYPQAIKSVADGGYFDGELLANMSTADSTGVIGANNGYVLSKNYIPCNGGNTVKVIYGEVARVIRVSFYDSTKAHISTSYLSNITEFEKVAPTNSAYFLFSISNTNSNITPQTAKPITVTINGKYALIVKSVGKNLLKNTATSQTVNGVTFTVNEDKSVTANGTANAWVNILLGSIKTTSNLTLSSETVGTSNGNAKIQYYNATKSQQITELSNGSYDYNNSNGDTIEVWTRIAPSTTVNNLTFYPMIRPVGTDDAYEPYKETVTYILLNEPLRSNLDGTVTDEVSFSEVTRRFAEVVLDGSEDWHETTVNKFIFAHTHSKESSYLLCSHYINLTDNEWISTGKAGIYKGRTNIGIYDARFSTVNELKAWLQANPITLQYELAEPIVETIEPVDIVTYDNVTYITASDNAEMELEYPTSKVAGIASIGYSKGIKAEYETEQLKKQLLEIQATIVNTL